MYNISSVEENRGRQIPLMVILNEESLTLPQAQSRGACGGADS
jgi:hypothetical protein